MEEKRQQIKNFFLVHKAVFPSWKAFLLKLSFIAFGFGLFTLWYFNNVFIVWVFSFLCIATGIFAFYKWLRPYFIQKALYAKRPTAEQMENWFLEDMNIMIKPKAIASFSLEPQKLKKENFIIVPHPVFWAIPGVKPEHTVRRHCDEHSFLYSVWNISIIAMSENYISCYSCVYNWLENQITNVRTNEFFYSDISSISDNMEILPHELVEDVSHSHAHEKTAPKKADTAETKHAKEFHENKKTESKYHQTEEDLHQPDKVYHTKEGKEHAIENSHEHNEHAHNVQEHTNNHEHDHSHNAHNTHNHNEHQKEESKIHKIETSHGTEHHESEHKTEHNTHQQEHKGADHGKEHHEPLAAKVVRITNLSSEQITVISEIPSMHVNHKTVNSLEKVVKVIRILVRNKRFGETNKIVTNTEHTDNSHNTHHH